MLLHFCLRILLLSVNSSDRMIWDTSYDAKSCDGTDFYLGFMTSGSQLVAASGGYCVGDEIDTALSVSPNQWVYMASVYSNAKLTVYVSVEGGSFRYRTFNIDIGDTRAQIVSIGGRNTRTLFSYAF